MIYRDITYLRQIIADSLTKSPPRLILAQRPWRLPDGIHPQRRPAPALQIKGSNQFDIILSSYPQERVHAIRFPYLCYVIEGEIDMQLGIPAKHGKMRGIVNSYDILPLPAHTALLIPPGTFFSDGSQPYWERPAPAADARIFWVHILPTGVSCHSSSTRKGFHETENLDLFVPGHQFPQLITMMSEELRLPGNEAREIAQSILPLFFRMIARGLHNGTKAATPSTSESSTQDTRSDKGNSIIIRQACDFIRTHNARRFTVEEVAAYAYVSPSHLMNLFRQELNTTVMGYVQEQRVETAQSWLINSEMSIKDIARASGYSQTPQFTRAFQRVLGCSPIEFRRQHRR
jgi:AraC-like DNA-binding protein